MIKSYVVMHHHNVSGLLQAVSSLEWRLASVGDREITTKVSG